MNIIIKISSTYQDIDEGVAYIGYMTEVPTPGGRMSMLLPQRVLVVDDIISVNQDTFRTKDAEYRFGTCPNIPLFRSFNSGIKPLQYVQDKTNIYEKASQGNAD